MTENNTTSYESRKRTFDCIFALAALIFLAPLYFLIAVLICADDPDGSPVFFQIRVGKNGKHFRLYKFRTMRKNAEHEMDRMTDRNEMQGPVFKIAKDERITRIGRFLRKSSLDELPQFINVLRGDMSVVGPRPPLPREVKEYTERQKLRLTITPGITCYWQVMPKRNSLSFEEWLELDLKYIRERSSRTDLKIMMQTILAMIRLQGE